MLSISSPAFENGKPIPRKHTGEGENFSPPLMWEGVPEGTAEWVLIVDDPDAPRAEPFVHWLLYGLGSDQTWLEEGSTGGGKQGWNDFKKPGYGGPMPPPGHGRHHYHFKLYALDAPLHLGPGMTKKDLLLAIEDHVLEMAEYVGTYER